MTQRQGSPTPDHETPLESGGRVLSLADTAVRCAAWRAAGQRVVLTNGCFDVLHAGHVYYLSAARQLGDRLVVALDEDASVRRLKGAGRPLNELADRAAVVAALRAVDAVTSFPGPTASAVVEALRPSVYVKGGDYDDRAHQPPEARIARRIGAEVRYLPFLAGRSTSELIERARREDKAKPGTGRASSSTGDPSSAAR